MTLVWGTKIPNDTQAGKAVRRIDTKDAGLTTTLGEGMCRVLIVDDDPETLALLEEVLSKDNTVMTAGTAADASMLCDLHHPDVALVDVYLGEDRGDILASQGYFGEATVLIMTAGDLPYERQAELLRDGVFDVIHKTDGMWLVVEKVKKAFMYRDALARASQGLKKHDTAIIHLEEAGEHFRKAHSALRAMTARVEANR